MTRRGVTALCILSVITLLACRDAANDMTTRILSFDDADMAFETGREFEPFPDARFAVLLDAASVQAFLLDLPIPAADRVRQRVLPLGADDAVVVVFLGTTPSNGYRARIAEIRSEPGLIEVVIAARAPNAAEETVVYGYPVDARRVPRSAFPSPPFDVVYRSASGTVWFRQTDVRPTITIPSEAAREDEIGDTLFVSRELRREYQDGSLTGRVIVREHESPSFALQWVLADERHILVSANLPLWLQPRGVTKPSCFLTDRTPDELAAVFPGDPWSNVTFRGRAVPIGRQGALSPLALDRSSMPLKAWLACVSSGRSDAAPRDWLGTTTVDLYPVRLEERDPYSIEVLEVKPLLHDVLVRIRLHPPPTDSVPLDLVVFDPPLVRDTSGEQLMLAAYVYYGFDREPSQLDYAISLHSDETGQFFTWLLAPETNEFTLFLRLTTCKAQSRVDRVSTWNPPAGIECGTMTAVQAFYTHRNFLQAFGLTEGTVTLQCAIVSPHGWRSEPFMLRLP